MNRFWICAVQRQWVVTVKIPVTTWPLSLCGLTIQLQWRHQQQKNRKLDPLVLLAVVFPDSKYFKDWCIGKNKEQEQKSDAVLVLSFLCIRLYVAVKLNTVGWNLINLGHFGRNFKLTSAFIYAFNYKFLSAWKFWSTPRSKQYKSLRSILRLTLYLITRSSMS